MFENELLLRIILKQNGILVEGTYLAGQLYAADQVDGDRAFVLADRIQERILNILCRLGIHGPISSCHRGQPFLDIPHLAARSNLAATQTCTLHPIVFDAPIQGHGRRRGLPRCKQVRWER